MCVVGRVIGDGRALEWCRYRDTHKHKHTQHKYYRYACVTKNEERKEEKTEMDVKSSVFSQRARTPAPLSDCAKGAQKTDDPTRYDDEKKRGHPLFLYIVHSPLEGD